VNQGASSILERKRVVGGRKVWKAFVFGRKRCPVATAIESPLLERESLGKIRTRVPARNLRIRGGGGDQ